MIARMLWVVLHIARLLLAVFDRLGILLSFYLFWVVAKVFLGSCYAVF